MSKIKTINLRKTTLEMLEELRPLAHSMANRYPSVEADDLINKTLSKLLARLQKQHGSDSDTKDFDVGIGYVIKCMRNMAIDLVRRQARETSTLSDYGSNHASSAMPLDESTARIQTFIYSLNELELRTYDLALDGLDPDEISQKLGKCKRHVYSQLKSIKKKLAYFCDLSLPTTGNRGCGADPDPDDDPPPSAPRFRRKERDAIRTKIMNKTMSLIAPGRTTHTRGMAVMQSIADLVDALVANAASSSREDEPDAPSSCLVTAFRPEHRPKPKPKPKPKPRSSPQRPTITVIFEGGEPTLEVSRDDQLFFEPDFLYISPNCSKCKTTLIEFNIFDHNGRRWHVQERSKDTEVLYHRLSASLLSFFRAQGCSRDTAQDLLQETFLALLAGRERQGWNITSPKGYVFTIARRLLARVNTRSKSSTRVSIEYDDASHHMDEWSSPRMDEAAINRIMLERVLQQRRTLCTRVVLSHYLEGYRASEISRRWGLSENTVRSRIRRGLLQLRTSLRPRQRPMVPLLA